MTKMLQTPAEYAAKLYELGYTNPSEVFELVCNSPYPVPMGYAHDVRDALARKRRAGSNKITRHTKHKGHTCIT